LNLRELLGLSGDTTDEELYAHISSMQSELQSTRDAVNLSNEDAAFRKQFPRMWEEHQQMIERDRDANSTAFVNSIASFKRPEGKVMKGTGWGLSAHAMDIVAETHKKFAIGEAGLADFESCIRSIADGGTVEYGERGSATPAPQLDAPAYDVSTAHGIRDARNLFFARVTEIQEEDSLSFDDALVEATKRYPDLANAYRANARV
jgi:hypothetical protein